MTRLRRAKLYIAAHRTRRKLRRALDIKPGDLLEMIDDPPKKKAKGKSSKSKKRKKAPK